MLVYACTITRQLGQVCQKVDIFNNFGLNLVIHFTVRET